MKAKRSGIPQIAELAGVSIGTVDRALHGRPGINDETRQRVLDIAKKIGYRPNLAVLADLAQALGKEGSPVRLCLIGSAACLFGGMDGRTSADLDIWKPASDYDRAELDRKSTRLNSSHLGISYAVFFFPK